MMFSGAAVWLLVMSASAGEGHEPERDHEHEEDRDPLRTLSVTPLVGVTNWRPPSGESASQNFGAGARVQLGIEPDRALGIAGRLRGSYLGMVGQDRRGREWRAGVLAGPRLGTSPGRFAEASLTLLAGAEFVNDTYRLESLGDSARVPRAWLLDVPLHARAVLGVIDVELGIAPSFFVDRQVGENTDRAPRPRPSWEGAFGDEFQMSSSVALKFGKVFRVGLSHRTRWTSYGRLTWFGLGFGVGPY